MNGTVHVFDFLSAPSKGVPLGMCVLFGGERFLKRLALDSLIRSVSDEEELEYAATFLEGDSASWTDVHDELATRSLFGSGGPQIVVVDHADKFVKDHRDRLGDYLDPPKPKSPKSRKSAKAKSAEEATPKQSPSNTGNQVPFSSLLILVVDTWLSTTILYREVEKSHLQIKCDAPLQGRSKNRDEKKVVDWLVARANREYQYDLPAKGAQLVVELTDCEFGRMDQELQKLVLYLDPKGKLSLDTIKQAVGGWQTRTTWDAVDAATEGDAGKALDLLNKLLLGGEHPLALFGQIASTLRRFSTATEIVLRQSRNREKIDVSAAIKGAGFPFWGGELAANERRLKQVSSKRASQISQWLLEADLALKRSHSKEEMGRLVLEQLLVRLAKELAPAK